MSSLGFQRIYRALMEAPGLACERAFLDDECESDAAREPEHPVTYESIRPIDELPVIAFSVAYELEMAGVVRMLEAAGIPARRRDRDARHPLVLAGGPLTFSNPAPLGGARRRDRGRRGRLARRRRGPRRRVGGPRATPSSTRSPPSPHVFVPARHAALPPVGAEDDAVLPAYSAIRTPHTELVGHVPHRDRARLLARLHATA